MPPPGNRAGPNVDDRQRAADSIKAILDAVEGVRDPGPSLIQRLTRRQYNNTIRDLLGVDTHPADAFPADGGGGAGFDNNASTLFVPPILMEKYLAAAADVLSKADPSRYIAARPGPDLSKDEAARRSIAAFARRAFRRPVESGEVERLMRLFRRAEARGDGFEAAVRLALRAVLVSPSFLYLLERDRTDVEGPYRVSDHELACRLSYFLWSSMPDGELSDLADAGRLHEPEVLALQVRRMLADPKSRAMAEDFAGQWLRVGSLAELAEPDKRLFPEYTPELRDAMVEEAVSFFHAILREDRPVLELLDSYYTFLNEPLARHYGIEGVTGPDFRRVELKDRRRGGVLGMAAVLTLTSYPRRTSPVLARQVGARGAAGHAPAATAGDGQVAADRRPPPQRPDLPRAARAAPQEGRVRLVPRPARPPRLRARELRRPGPMARRGPEEAGRRLRQADHRRGVHRGGGPEDDPGRDEARAVRPQPGGADALLRPAEGRGILRCSDGQADHGGAGGEGLSRGDAGHRGGREPPVPVPAQWQPRGHGDEPEESTDHAADGAAGAWARWSACRCWRPCGRRWTPWPPPTRRRRRRPAAGPDGLPVLAQRLQPPHLDPQGPGQGLRVLADPQAAGPAQGRRPDPDPPEQPGHVHRRRPLRQGRRLADRDDDPSHHRLRPECRRRVDGPARRQADRRADPDAVARAGRRAGDDRRRHQCRLHPAVWLAHLVVEPDHAGRPRDQSQAGLRPAVPLRRRQGRRRRRRPEHPRPGHRRRPRPARSDRPGRSPQARRVPRLGPRRRDADRLRGQRPPRPIRRRRPGAQGHRGPRRPGRPLPPRPRPRSASGR